MGIESLFAIIRNKVFIGVSRLKHIISDGFNFINSEVRRLKATPADKKNRKNLSFERKFGTFILELYKDCLSAIFKQRVRSFLKKILLRFGKPK